MLSAALVRPALLLTLAACAPYSIKRDFDAYFRTFVGATIDFNLAAQFLSAFMNAD